MIRGLARAIENQKVDSMMKMVHDLKGASVYGGASRLHYCGLFMQYLLERQQIEVFREYNLLLIEQFLEFTLEAFSLMARISPD